MMLNSSSIKQSHLVFFPCPGMGHLIPFLRLAAKLASRNHLITVIDTKPPLSDEEDFQISSFFSDHPEINCLELKIRHSENSSSAIHDIFMVQFEAINRSLYLLPPLLASLPQPVSAIFSDFAVSASFTQIIADLGIPNYIISTTSARCFSTVAYLPMLISEATAKFSDCIGDLIKIPGIAPLPKSIIPPSWLDNSPSNHLLNAYLIPNSRSLPKVNGVLLNSFNWFEAETIQALNDGIVLSNLPPILPIGPLEPHKLEKVHNIPWLDEQDDESVVFASFGSRIVMAKDQLRELGDGLKRSGCPFLWILGGDKVDELDEHKEIQELLGDSFIEEIKDRGVIMRRWVDQEVILGHSAIGGFINQCEWDPVTDAAREGVPILAWPQHGDQKMNAEVVENSGLGIWVKEWGWGGERLVKGEEIGERVRELMVDENLRVRAKKVGEEARKACEIGESSEKMMTVIEMLLIQTPEGYIQEFFLTLYP